MNKQKKEELEKLLKDVEGRPFSELPEIADAQASREYPDFGGELPESTYLVSGLFRSHEWKNRSGRVSQILTVILVDEDGEEAGEVAIAAFYQREWGFIEVVEGNEAEKEVKCLFGFEPKLSKRTAKMADVEPLTAVKVRHAWGHFADPYASKVFNRRYTWIEKAE